MSMERDLLWKIQQVLQCERDDYGFVGEIENLLTQPEQSETEKEHKHMQKWLNLGYAHGIVDAEKAHDIGGDDE